MNDLRERKREAGEFEISHQFVLNHFSFSAQHLTDSSSASSDGLLLIPATVFSFCDHTLFSDSFEGKS